MNENFARALLSLRRFYYVFHATRERDVRNNNNTSMKESPCVGARMRM
jgi:hypothetical protein